jgi:hypothetical protein
MTFFGHGQKMPQAADQAKIHLSSNVILPIRKTYQRATSIGLDDGAGWAQKNIQSGKPPTTKGEAPDETQRRKGSPIQGAIEARRPTGLENGRSRRG